MSVLFIFLKFLVLCYITKEYKKVGNNTHITLYIWNTTAVTCFCFKKAINVGSSSTLALSPPHTPFALLVSQRALLDERSTILLIFTTNFLEA